MVLKDFYCDVCQEIIEATVSVNTSELDMHCGVCQSTTLHKSLCNGGTKSRWRCCDFDFSDDRELSKHVKLGKAEAVDEKGNPIIDRHGKAIHDQIQYSQDKVNESIEKSINDRERVKGKRPLFFH